MGNNPAVPLFLVVLFLVLCFQAKAQQQKVYRAGVPMIGSSAIPSMKGLRDGLNEFGYVEGKEPSPGHPCHGNHQRTPADCQVLHRKESRCHCHDGCHSITHRQGIDTRNPHCVRRRFRPYSIRTCKSVARPEANVTGVASATDVEIEGKRLELFKEAVPTLRRVAVLYNARGENPIHAKSLALVQKVAPRLGLKLIEKPD